MRLQQQDRQENSYDTYGPQLPTITLVHQTMAIAVLKITLSTRIISYITFCELSILLAAHHYTLH